MINNVKKLIVKYNSKEVGYLVEIENGIAFEYSDAWIKDGICLITIL